MRAQGYMHARNDLRWVCLCVYVRGVFVWAHLARTSSLLLNPMGSGLKKAYTTR